MASEAEDIMVAILALITGLPTTSTRVVRSRVYTFEGVNGLTLKMGSDVPVDGTDQNLGFIDFNLEVIVTAHSKNADVETEINLIKKEVISAVKADYTVSGTATDINEEGWDAADVEAAEEYTGISTGIFMVRYRRARAGPKA